MKPILLWFLAVIPLGAVETTPRLPIYLSMDPQMWEDWKGSIENYGCVHSQDAVRGQCLLLDNRSFFVLRSSSTSWFGSGDFSLLLWFRMLPDWPEPEARLQGEWFSANGVIFNKSGIRSHYGITAQTNMLVAGGQYEGLTDDSATRMRLSIGENGAFPLKPMEWTGLAIVRNSQTTRFWVNGTLVRETVDPLTADFSNSGPIIIGAYEDGRQCFRGWIDELRIEPRAWTSDEVMQWYDSHAPAASAIGGG